MLSSHTKQTIYSWLLDLTCAFCLIGLFYTLWLGHHPLFTPDEGRYSEIAREMVATGDYITPRLNGVAFLDKPALYYWLQASAITLFGLKEWALRLWPALMGVIGCVSTLMIGRWLFNRHTGWLAAITLATSPIYYGGAHYANLDLEVAVLITLTLYALIAGLQFPAGEKTRSHFFLAAWILAALAFLTKGMIALAFPATITTLWLICSGQFRSLKEMLFFKGPLLFAALVLPWYFLVEKANPGFLRFFFIDQQVLRFLAHGDFNNQSAWWFYLPVVFAGFLPWSIFAAQAIKDAFNRKGLSGIDGFFLLWLGTVLIFFSIPKSKTIGYILPIFPPLAILTARYLDHFWQENLKREKLGLSLFLLMSWVVLPAITLITLFKHHAMGPWLLIAALILALMGGIVFTLARQSRSLGTGWAAMAAGSILFCITFLGSATTLNHDSLKPLALQLNTHLQSGDEVVTYYKYYQDLPIYLQRRITIVADWQAADIPERDNWVREMWYGIRFQNTSDWLISEKTLWERWRSPRRVVVLLDKRRFQQFAALSGNTVKEHGEYGEVAWASNR